MGGWRLLGSTVGVALLGLVASLTLVPTAQAYEDWQDWNDYIVSDLPEYISAPMPFTVTVDGPLPVCSMTYNGSTLAAAPWAFTAPLTKTDNAVHVTLCDGNTDELRVWTAPAFEFGSSYLTATKESKRRTTYGLSVANHLDQPATITVIDQRGKVVATGSAKANSSIGWFGEPSMTFSTPKLKKTSRFTVRVTAQDGTSIDSSVVAPVGWTVMLGQPEYENCSTVKWFYDDRHVPKDARKIPTDIVKALALLQARGGLTFARTTTPDDAQLVFSWDNLGEHGPSALGGTDGTVVFNTKDLWPEDEHAGVKMVHSYLPGRVWLIVHEVMHTMGFGHVDQRDELMYPVGHMSKFGTGDLAGLKAMYPKSACRA